MISMKMGMGGYGLQACDAEGKYVEVGVTVGGAEVKSFDDFLALFEGGKIGEALKGPQAEAVKEKLFEKYKGLFQKSIDEMNEAEEPYKPKSATDFINNADKVFTAKFAKALNAADLKNEDIKTKSKRHTKINDCVAFLLGHIYGRKAFRMAKEEDLAKIETDDRFVDDHLREGNGDSTLEELRMMKPGSAVKVFRCLNGFSSVKGKEDAFKSYYDESDPTPSVGGGGNGFGYYFSLTKPKAYDGFFNSKSDSMKIHGVVKDVDKLKIISARTYMSIVPDGPEFDDTREYLNFRDKAGEIAGDIRLAIKNALVGHGCESGKADLFAEAITSECVSGSKEVICALLGVDATTGFGKELALLNPNAMILSNEWEG